MHASMPFWELEKSRNIFEISIVFHVLQYVWILSLLPILRLKAKGFLEICIHGSRPTTAGMVGVYWNSRQEGPVEPAAVFFNLSRFLGRGLVILLEGSSFTWMINCFSADWPKIPILWRSWCFFLVSLVKSRHTRFQKKTRTSWGWKKSPGFGGLEVVVLLEFLRFECRFEEKLLPLDSSLPHLSAIKEADVCYPTETGFLGRTLMAIFPFILSDVLDSFPLPLRCECWDTIDETDLLSSDWVLLACSREFHVIHLKYSSSISCSLRVGIGSWVMSMSWVCHKSYRFGVETPIARYKKVQGVANMTWIPKGRPGPFGQRKVGKGWGFVQETPCSLTNG